MNHQLTRKFLIALLGIFLFTIPRAAFGCAINIDRFHKDPGRPGKQVKLQIQFTYNGQPCENLARTIDYTYSTTISLGPLPDTCMISDIDHIVNDVKIWVEERYGDVVTKDVQNFKLGRTKKNEAGQFELVPLRDAFVELGNEESLNMPMIYSADVELYLGIDLAGYLGQAVPAWTEQDSLTILGGRVFNDTGDEFPGLLVGTSEISFSETLGMYTAEPFNGSASIDGSIGIFKEVPEPGTATFLAIGSIWLIANTRGRGAKGDDLPPKAEPLQS